jgi:hypothetical protein
VKLADRLVSEQILEIAVPIDTNPSGDGEHSPRARRRRERREEAARSSSLQVTGDGASRSGRRSKDSWCARHSRLLCRGTGERRTKMRFHETTKLASSFC